MLGVDGSALNSTLYSDRIWYDVLTHELGHALGLVYPKNNGRFLLNTDYPETQKIYNTMGQKNFNQILLSKDGNHWSQYSFKNTDDVIYPGCKGDVMLPVVNMTNLERITLLSIKGLVDYGYEEVAPNTWEGTPLPVYSGGLFFGQQEQYRTSTTDTIVNIECGHNKIPIPLKITLGTVCMTDSQNCVFVSNHQTSTDLQGTGISYR